MKMRLLPCLLIIVGFGGGNANTPQREVVLISLANPVYPRLAMQARVAGDVEVELSVRSDGTIESADVVSGPPMLKQAALDSVHQSHFECRECGENATSYRMVYTFQTLPPQYGPHCEVIVDPTYPQVIQSQNHVTVIDQPIGPCDLGSDITKVRSMRCLFLWKCGRR
jgi:TonB family protein